jgi:hypothetical protein
MTSTSITAFAAPCALAALLATALLFPLLGAPTSVWIGIAFGIFTYHYLELIEREAVTPARTARVVTLLAGGVICAELIWRALAA